MEQKMRDFLWQGNSEVRKVHLVAWDVVCTNLTRGGLGIQNLRIMNKAMLGKLLWRIYTDHSALWSKAIRSKYLDSDHAERIFIVADIPIDSMVWNGLRKVCLLVTQFLKWIPVTGAKTHFWYDTWLVDRPLADLPTLANLKEHLSRQWGALVQDYWHWSELEGVKKKKWQLLGTMPSDLQRAYKHWILNSDFINFNPKEGIT